VAFCFGGKEELNTICTGRLRTSWWFSSRHQNMKLQKNHLRKKNNEKYTNN
jgi:hypothetical protein